MAASHVGSVTTSFLVFFYGTDPLIDSRLLHSFIRFFIEFSVIACNTFSALTLLVGYQEGMRCVSSTVPKSSEWYVTSAGVSLEKLDSCRKTSSSSSSSSISVVGATFKIHDLF